MGQPAGQCVSVVPREVAAAVRQLAAHTKTTEFVVLLAAYGVLLSRHCQQADILIGVPVSTRRTGEETLVGDFVNTAALRLNLAELGSSGGPCFRAVLEAVQSKLLLALQHQLPWQLLVQEVRKRQELPPHLSPVVQTMFDYSAAGDFGFHQAFNGVQAGDSKRSRCDRVVGPVLEGGRGRPWRHFAAVAFGPEDSAAGTASKDPRPRFAAGRVLKRPAVAELRFELSLDLFATLRGGYQG